MTWVGSWLGAEPSGGGGGGETVPPVVSITYPVAHTDPLIVQAYDVSSALRITEVSIRLPGSWRWVAYETSENFLPPFDRGSTLTGAGTFGDPYIATIYRAGGWPTGVVIDVKTIVIDAAGNRITV